MKEIKCFIEVNVIANTKLEAIHMLESLIDECSLCDTQGIIACEDNLNVRFGSRGLHHE